MQLFTDGNGSLWEMHQDPYRMKSSNEEGINVGDTSTGIVSTIKCGYQY